MTVEIRPCSQSDYKELFKKIFWGTLGLSSVEFWNCHFNCQNFMILIHGIGLCIMFRNYDYDNHHQNILPKDSPSLQVQKLRLQFYRRQVFHRKLRNQGCSFTRDWIGAGASRCFLHPTLSLATEQTLKDLKRSQGHQCTVGQNANLAGKN